MIHVREIAQRPHPVGSLDHDRVRDYLRDQLARLGLHPMIETGVGSFNGESSRVENVLGRLYGAANTRPVMLVAHYDSVRGGPGAADDGHGVAVLLETLRALKSGSPLRNDVIFLITDGEEIELLGAALFVKEHPWRNDPGVVLNFEARGTSGPPSMFETSRANAWLLENLKAAAPWANAASLAYEVYRRMPNDTDLTVFKRNGLAGLNFAFIDHPEFYHTASDDPQHLDVQSLQEQGDYAVALARRFGNEDLRPAHTGDAIYFRTPITPLIVYPVQWARPLTWAAGALLLLSASMAWLRKTSSLWIAVLLALPLVLLILSSAAAPGASYALQWPLFAAALAYLVLVTAPPRIGMGWRLFVLMISVAPPFLLLAPLLQPLGVALGRQAPPVVTATGALILICVAPQLLLVFRRGPRYSIGANEGA